MWTDLDVGKGEREGGREEKWEGGKEREEEKHFHVTSSLFTTYHRMSCFKEITNGG